MQPTSIPLVSVVGLSGSGKTTLLTGLIPRLRQAGLRVGTIKHHAHAFDMDTTGKDSWRHRRAGAACTLLSSPRQIGMIRDVDHDPSPQDLLPWMAGMDFVLAEGYKRSNTPKIEVYRSEIAERPVCLDDPLLLALVTEAETPWDGPRFSPTDFAGLTRFLLDRFHLAP